MDPSFEPLNIGISLQQATQAITHSLGQRSAQEADPDLAAMHPPTPSLFHKLGRSLVAKVWTGSFGSKRSFASHFTSADFPFGKSLYRIRPRVDSRNFTSTPHERIPGGLYITYV